LAVADVHDLIPAAARACGADLDRGHLPIPAVTRAMESISCPAGSHAKAGATMWSAGTMPSRPRGQPLRRGRRRRRNRSDGRRFLLEHRGEQDTFRFSRTRRPTSSRSSFVTTGTRDRAVAGTRARPPLHQVQAREARHLLAKAGTPSTSLRYSLSRESSAFVEVAAASSASSSPSSHVRRPPTKKGPLNRGAGHTHRATAWLVSASAREPPPEQPARYCGACAGHSGAASCENSTQPDRSGTGHCHHRVSVAQ